jgi:hypothetical protein
MDPSPAGLVSDKTPEKVRGAISRRILSARARFAIGAALCVINTYWSIAFIVLVQLNYVVAPRPCPGGHGGFGVWSAEESRAGGEVAEKGRVFAWSNVAGEIS